LLSGGGDSDEEDDVLEAALEAAEGVKKYNMKTSVLEEKSAGCSMLCSFAHDLEVHFFPFVNDTARVLLPGITYTFSEEVRQHSTAAMPCLMKCTVQAFSAGRTLSKQEQILCTDSHSDSVVFMYVTTFAAYRDRDCIRARTVSGHDCGDCQCVQNRGRHFCAHHSGSISHHGMMMFDSYTV
jgi:hypothetical protein